MYQENNSPEDFIADESFVNWVNRANDADVRRWSDWLEANPQHREAAEEAARMIRVLQSFQKTPLSDAVRERAIQSVQSRIAASSSRSLYSFPPFGLRWQSVAASVALLLLAVAGVWYLNRSTVYKTDYAEVRSVILPDGSVVTMNANSELRLNNDWQDRGTRELWLQGEAFFSVKHTENNSKFIVHTKDAEVEVLGTTFSVYERQNKTRVVLNTGKVKLTDRKTASEVIMQPGDLVEVAAHPVRKIVDTRRYTSWKDRTLIFDNTPLSEIAQMIQENYGYTVEIKDKELSDVRFTYTLKDNNLNLLITALSEALELKITEKNKTLTIEKSVSENE